MRITIFGLICDIVGVAILARALVSRTNRDFRLHVSAVSPHGLPLTEVTLFRTLAEERYDSRYGLCVVIVGFGLQILGAARIVDPGETIMLLASCALLIVVAVYHSDRNHRTNITAIRLFRSYLQWREQVGKPLPYFSTTGTVSPDDPNIIILSQEMS